MPIPDYQTLMLPLLKAIADKKKHSLGEVLEILCDQIRLPSEERQRLLPSGQQTIIHNRVGWARTYMVKAGLIDSVRRGYFRLSARGATVLASNPDRIDVHYLDQFPEFVQFRNLHHKDKDNDGAPTPTPDSETPEEALEGAYRRLRSDLESELLERVKTVSPAFFERTVVELLVSMGYGGNLRDAGQAVGRAGDGGVDGIIKEDQLGLDTIYIQAKRWDATVGRPEIQRFAGVLQGHRARKGVFITTSGFSSEATEYADRIDSKIVLIDGQMLATLMVDHGIGVSTAQAYEVKKIDSDYFLDE